MRIQARGRGGIIAGTLELVHLESGSAGQQVSLGTVAFTGHAIDQVQTFAPVASPNERRAQKPRHRQIVGVCGFLGLEDGYRLFILAEVGVAIGQQCGDARVIWLRGAQRAELLRRVAPSAFLVVRQRQIEPEARIVLFHEHREVLFDGFVVTVQFCERGSQIGAHFDGVRIAFEEFPIVADGERIVSALLRRNSVAEELLGTWRLARKRRRRRRGMPQCASIPE